MYGKILRALGHLTGAMILVSTLWTAWNVVSLLGTANPIGYAVAGMFDAAWLVATAVQVEMRYRVELRGRLAAVGWSLAGLAAAVNVASELIGRHGIAVAVVAAVVPVIAKTCVALKLLVETNSIEAKTRFVTLTQSWADQVTELRISEAMASQWHRVERVHENADARRLAATQQDRLANLELTSGAETPVTRIAEPVTWAPPTRQPLAPLFKEPVQEPAEAAQGDDVVRLVRDGAPADMPQLSKADAITAAWLLLGDDASPADIAHHLAQQGVATDTAYVRTVRARARKAAEKPDRPVFGFH